MTRISPLPSTADDSEVESDSTGEAVPGSTNERDVVMDDVDEERERDMRATGELAEMKARVWEIGEWAEGSSLSVEAVSTSHRHAR